MRGRKKNQEDEAATGGEEKVKPGEAFGTQAPCYQVASCKFQLLLLSQVALTSGEESACNAGDLGSVLGWGRSPGEGRCNPLQSSCLAHPRDRGACRATVHGDRRESAMT